MPSGTEIQSSLNLLGGVDSWQVIATGYAGDPAFMVPIPNTTEFLLGAGFGGNVYRFDWSNPQDYSAGSETNIGSHFAAVYLTDKLIAIDRGDFGSPAETVVIDAAAFDVRGIQSVQPKTILSRPPSAKASGQVVEKPAGSYSASIALDVSTGRFYVTDGGNGQIKSFALADILNAYNTSTPLDWNTDGTNVGTPFQFPTGEVSGFTASGNVVMAGSCSIVEVEPLSATLVKSLDPAGTGPFYRMIYNSVTEDFIAVQSNYPNPDIIHTTQSATPPNVPVGIIWLLIPMLSCAYLYVNRRSSTLDKS